MNTVRLLLCGAITMAVCASTHADTVTLTAGDDASGRIEISGDIVDLTGKQITIQRPGGAERDYPTSRVHHIDTTWPAGYEQGLAELAADRYSQAAKLLAAAAQGEPRPWARRLMMEKLMQCYASAGDVTTAGRLLVQLARSDPTTPALQHAPLAWYTTDKVPPAVVDEWLADASPAAQLLGASYALSGSQRTEAIAILTKLARSGDEQLAPLARIESWRADLVTATDDDLARWQRQLREMPEPLQTGGWLVLGDAHLQKRAFDDAALAYLRCHQLAERQPQLAGQALLRAARTLNIAGQVDEAAKLAEQLTRQLPQTAAAREGRVMLQSP